MAQMQKSQIQITPLLYLMDLVFLVMEMKLTILLELMCRWNWKANGGTTSSNSDGSITSTVQANTDAGFSIVTYTGTGLLYSRSWT